MSMNKLNAYMLKMASIKKTIEEISGKSEVKMSLKLINDEIYVLINSEDLESIIEKFYEEKGL